MTSRDFPCLYCLRHDGVPSVEHVVPAGLGVHADIELPAWAVCEECNNRLGRQVDEALVHTFEVLMLRGLWQVPDHRGRKVSHIDVRDGALEFDEDGKFRLTAFIGEQDGPWEKPAPGTSLTLSVTTRRGNYRDQRRRIARAILKIGLGFAHHQEGPSFALHQDFDPARRAVLGQPYDGYLLSKLGPLEMPPHLNLSLLFKIPGMKVACRFDFGWVHFLVDLIPGPLPVLTREWAASEGWEPTEIVNGR